MSSKAPSGQVGLSICLISSVAIGIMSGVTIGGSVWVVLSPQLMSVAALMPLIGYVLGYAMSTIFQLNHQYVNYFTRTIVFEPFRSLGANRGHTKLIKCFVFFRCRRTISMETGCQNIQLCATILKVAFSPQVIGPLYLFPLIYIVFQGGEALIFIVLFRCYEALKPRAEGKCHS